MILTDPLTLLKNHFKSKTRHCCQWMMHIICIVDLWMKNLVNLLLVNGILKNIYILKYRNLSCMTHLSTINGL